MKLTSPDPHPSLGAQGTTANLMTVLVAALASMSIAPAPASAVTGMNASTSSSGWSVVPSANPAGSTQADFSAMSCVSATFCEAVGDYADSGSETFPVAEVWNGATWSIQATNVAVNSGDKAQLNGVSCVSATFCEAVGVDNVAGLIEVWNGVSWTQQVSDDTHSGAPLQGVSCASATACEAVGINPVQPAEPFAEAWNGVSWTQQSTAGPGGVTAPLFGVSCVTATSCEAVGTTVPIGGHGLPFAEIWDGVSWSLQTIPTPPATSGISLLRGISCASAASCVAVGELDNNLRPLAEVWNGTAWAYELPGMPSGSSGGALGAVSCTSASTCQATGSYAHTGGQDGWASMLNGGSWSVQRTAIPTGSKGSALAGVWCGSATSCNAVGSYTNSSSVVVPLGEVYAAPLTVATRVAISGAHPYSMGTRRYYPIRVYVKTNGTPGGYVYLSVSGAPGVVKSYKVPADNGSGVVVDIALTGKIGTLDIKASYAGSPGFTAAAPYSFDPTIVH